MEKIYISGRISGLQIEEVAAKFDETETINRGFFFMEQ